MKASIIIGILLIVLGVPSLVYQGIPYTTQEDEVSLAPVNISAGTEKLVPLPPLVGGILLAGGTLLVAKGMRPANT